MMELLQHQLEVQTPMEEVVHDVFNAYDEDHYIAINHVQLNGEVQQEFGIEDHYEELQMKECVSDPIVIVVYLKVGVEVEVTGDIEVESFLHENVKS